MSSDHDLARAESLIDLRRYGEAEALLRGVLLHEPESAAALRLLTLALLGQAEAGAAGPTAVVQVAERAVAAEPESDEAHRALAFVLLQARRSEDALGAARESVRLNPAAWENHYVSGLASHARWSTKEDALESAQEALRLAPHEAAPHTLAGLCYQDLGLIDSAATEYREALRLDPDDAMALNNLATLDLNRGSLAAAGSLLNSGLSIAPHEGLLRQNYDVLLLRLVRRLYFALAGLGVVLYVMATDGASYPARAGTAAVLLTIFAGSTFRVTRTLPRRAHLWARGLLGRITTPQQVMVLTFLVLSFAVLVMGLAPTAVAERAGLATLRLCQLLFVVNAIAGLASRRGRGTDLPPNDGLR